MSNGPPWNYCKVPNEHIIGHVLVGQNGGSTTRQYNTDFFFLFHIILMNTNHYIFNISIL